MSVAAGRIRDITEAQRIQLRVPFPAGGIDREQNGPCDQAANEADGAENAQETEEEIAIE